jgi:putative membrane protein
MKKCLWTGTMIFTFISCTKVTEDNDAMSNKDFVLRASIVNNVETEVGSLAAKKAMDDGVRAFAERITDYHSTAQAHLRNLAIGLNVFAPDSIDAEHMTLKNQLLGLSDRAFDSLYIHTRLDDYHSAINLLFQEMLTGENEQLRDYSASLLPTLEVYLHQADSLANKY